MTLRPATGIVLAGGRSSRFGRDKLAVPIEGVPLIHHPVLALAAVCSEVVVVLAPDAPEPSMPTGTGVPVRFVRDQESFGGPLIGILAGLEHAAGSLALLVGGDMPLLDPALLQLLLRRLAAGESEALALVYQRRRQQLPCALRSQAALPVARRLVAVGERSIEVLLRNLRTGEVDEADWRPLDADAVSLRDVDRPEDVRRAGPDHGR